MAYEDRVGKFISEIRFDSNGFNSKTKQNFSIWGVVCERETEKKKDEWKLWINMKSL